MNEEITCFIRAAELGCPDFRLYKTGKPVAFYDCEMHTWALPSTEMDAKQNARINRYAAAVCCEFWHQLWSKYPEDADHLSDDCQNMISEARNFGRKYGVGITPTRE